MHISLKNGGFWGSLAISCLLEELHWPQKLLKRLVRAGCPHCKASAWPKQCLWTYDSHGQVETQWLLQSWFCPQLSGRVCWLSRTHAKEGCRDCGCGGIEGPHNTRKGSISSLMHIIFLPEHGQLVSAVQQGPDLPDRQTLFPWSQKQEQGAHTRDSDKSVAMGAPGLQGCLCLAHCLPQKCFRRAQPSEPLILQSLWSSEHPKGEWFLQLKQQKQGLCELKMPVPQEINWFDWDFQPVFAPELLARHCLKLLLFFYMPPKNTVENNSWTASEYLSILLG